MTATTPARTAPDPVVLEELAGRVIGDLGAAMHLPLVALGDRLGLFRAMAEAGPVTAAELAERTGCAERYLREWLSAQAASGYAAYDPEGERFWLTPEQAVAFADEDSPFFLAGGSLVVTAAASIVERLETAFRTGEGVGWHEQHPLLFLGTERFFRPGYIGNLLSAWLPALDDVEDKLRAGGRVADIGCGFGASTILIGGAFPTADVVGFDYHAPSIEAARQRAAEADVDSVRFDVATSSDFPGSDYDVIAFFDCFHDLGDPPAAARHARSALADDGTLLLVEPLSGDRLEDNLTPLGRAFYSASTLVCTPASLAQEGQVALGAQAGETRLRAILTEAGFTRVRRVSETPPNLVLEARP
jgi:SAM-dependent methyltransferase